MAHYTAATIAVKRKDTDELLLMKRSETKDMDPGLWEFPGGGIEKDEKPQEAARRELKEETGLKAQITRKGKPDTVKTHHGLLKVYPFLAETDNPEIKISSEHEKYIWIKKEDLDSFETVPGLKLEIEALNL